MTEARDFVMQEKAPLQHQGMAWGAGLPFLRASTLVPLLVAAAMVKGASRIPRCLRAQGPASMWAACPTPCLSP